MHIVTCRKPTHLAIFWKIHVVNLLQLSFLCVCVHLTAFSTLQNRWVWELHDLFTLSLFFFFFFFLPCSIHCFYSTFLSFILQLFSSSVESFFFHYICFSVFLNLASISLPSGSCESNKLLPWSMFVLFVTPTSWFFGIESSPFHPFLNLKFIF